MNPVPFLVRVFIDVFGITQPTPQQRRGAEIFITVLMIFVLILFLVSGYFFLHGFRR